MKAQARPVIVALLLVPGLAYGQEQASDTVQDPLGGFALPGLNAVLKGTIAGSATDAVVAFTLTVPSLDDTLAFSFLGYDTKEVPIAGRSQVDVSLSEMVYDVGQELVVTGYGAQERRSITRSVASLDSDDFVAGNISSPTGLYAYSLYAKDSTIGGVMMLSK